MQGFQTHTQPFNQSASSCSRHNKNHALPKRGTMLKSIPCYRCSSVHRGRGWLPSMHYRSHDQHPLGRGAVGFPACITGHMTSIWGMCIQGVCIWGVCQQESWWGLHPGGSTYRGGVGQTPLPELEKQAVHILLECFLVLSMKNNSRVALT